MTFLRKTWFMVQRLPDGAAGGAAAGAEGGSDAGSQTGESGVVAEAAAQGQAAADPKERASRFEAMIRGEFKDLYDAKVQKTVQGRLRSAKAAEESLNAITPALQTLQKAYGVEDLTQLAEAINNDDRFYEDEAQKRGMDVATFKALQQKDAAIAALRAQQEAAAERERQTNQVLKWRQEETALKEKFPDFDLDAEIDNSNGELFQLLERGIPLEHAYMTLHFDDIVGTGLATAVQRGAQRTIDTIRANGLRPQENGAGSSPGVKAAVDMSKLTRQRIAELEKRAARGETITPDMF